MGRAEELLNKIVAGRSRAIVDMVEAKITEELFLDYKRVATKVGSKALHDDDQKNLGKALAGFANSEGGLIIWGVDCRHRPGGDIPIVHAVEEPTWFKSLLEGACGGATLPQVSGVLHRAVPLDGQSHGFVVTYIPAGPYAPYMSITKGAQNYYIRAGSSFFPVPHGVLAGMFGRRPQPDIITELTPRYVMFEPDRRVQLNFQISLKNIGRGIAASVFGTVGITADKPVDTYESNFNEKSFNVLDRFNVPWTLVLKNDLLFPQGAKLILMTASFGLSQRAASSLLINLRCGAADCPLENLVGASSGIS